MFLFFHAFCTNASWIPHVTSPHTFILIDTRQRKRTNTHSLSRVQTTWAASFKRRRYRRVMQYREVALPPARHDKRAMLHPDRAIWAGTLHPPFHTKNTQTHTAGWQFSKVTRTKWRSRAPRQLVWKLPKARFLCKNIPVPHLWSHTVDLPKLNSGAWFRYSSSHWNKINWNLTPEYTMSPKLQCESAPSRKTWLHYHQSSLLSPQYPLKTENHRAVGLVNLNSFVARDFSSIWSSQCEKMSVSLRLKLLEVVL